MAQAPLDLIRSTAAKYPEAEKAFLFGDHEVYRVKKKVFVWLGEGEKGGTYVSVKLKDSQQAALMLPFVSPASYGMAKWGWIAAEFPKGKLPADLIAQWIDESYRHTAPKKLLKQLEPGAATVTKKGPARAGVAAAAKKKQARASAAKKGSAEALASKARRRA